tara:strand:- start:244 stop:837 length:594 start_codon:yes stop_codon:yes gene_type:complete
MGMDLFSKYIRDTENVELAKELYPVCKQILEETSEDKRYLYGKTTWFQPHIMNKYTSEFNNFFKFVDNEVNDFLKHQCIDVTNAKINMNEFWLSEMYEGGSHSCHVHSPHNQLSGNFYVYSEPNSSNIVFNRGVYNDVWSNFNKTDFTKYNSPEWCFVPTQGKFLLWESDLLHEVKTNESKSRMALTFNIKITEEGE